MAEVKTVLLVDDEVPVAQLLQTALEKEGYTVMTAHDGEAGLKSAITNHPDLIIADTVLPKLNGVDMVRRIKTHEWGKRAQIIMLANTTQIPALAEALEHEEFLTIPKGQLTIQAVIEKIRAYTHA